MISVSERAISLVVALLCATIFGCSSGGSAVDAPPQKMARERDAVSRQPWPVQLIRFDLAPFIDDARTRSGTLRVEAVSKHDEGEWQQRLSDGLQKYARDLLPPGFHVYPCQSLEVNSVRIAGTFWTMGVVVAAPRRDSSPGYEEYVLHHEVSSWLLSANWFSLNWEAWLATNRGFTYLEDPFEAHRLGARPRHVASEPFLEMGLITEYAAASQIDDFAEVSAHLFLGDPEFWTAVDNYEVIRTKARLAIDFFASLDDRFTEDYFRSFAGDEVTRAGTPR